jgi:TetR/AcrR family transcriptional regulator of autoinduction and epiphytic fitness
VPEDVANVETAELQYGTDVWSTDGRVARGQRTRQRVAESLIALLDDGVVDPTAREIAQRAGVSLRLVFHHFEDLEELYQMVFELQMERHWQSLPEVSPQRPLAERTAALVRIRASLYEAITPVRRAALRRIDRSPVLGVLLDKTNRTLSDAVCWTFSPELYRAGTDRDDLLLALDTAASWECWERLRRNQGASVLTARRVMARSLESLAGGSGPVGALP